jgi:hypothetical protein
MPEGDKENSAHGTKRLPATKIKRAILTKTVLKGRHEALPKNYKRFNGYYPLELMLPIKIQKLSLKINSGG